MEIQIFVEDYRSSYTCIQKQIGLHQCCYGERVSLHVGTWYIEGGDISTNNVTEEEWISHYEAYLVDGKWRRNTAGEENIKQVILYSSI